jgi:hypothetical protein
LQCKSAITVLTRFYLSLYISFELVGCFELVFGERAWTS